MKQADGVRKSVQDLNEKGSNSDDKFIRAVKILELRPVLRGNKELVQRARAIEWSRQTEGRQR